MNKEKYENKQRKAMIFSVIGALLFSIMGIFTENETNYFGKFVITFLGAMMGMVYYNIFLLLKTIMDLVDDDED